jgi:excisionase family DNA binding protein
MMSANQFLDTHQAAEYLDHSKSCLEWWRLENRGPKYFKLGRKVRYRVADLDAWLAARVVTTSEAK